MSCTDSFLSMFRSISKLNSTRLKRIPFVRSMVLETTRGFRSLSKLALVVMMMSLLSTHIYCAAREKKNLAFLARCVRDRIERALYFDIWFAQPSLFNINIICKLIFFYSLLLSAWLHLYYNFTFSTVIYAKNYPSAQYGYKLHTNAMCICTCMMCVHVSRRIRYRYVPIKAAVCVCCFF